jgi:hypothetical protein
MVRGAEPLCFGDRMAGIYTCMEVCSAINVHEQHIYLLVMEKKRPVQDIISQITWGTSKNTRASHNYLCQLPRFSTLQNVRLSLLLQDQQHSYCPV